VFFGIDSTTATQRSPALGLIFTIRIALTVFVVAAVVAKVTRETMEVDEALAKLGTIGRWQIRYFLMISAACMVMPCLHMLAINYIGEYTVLAHSTHWGLQKITACTEMQTVEHVTQ